MSIPFNPLKELPPEPWEPQSYYVVNVSMRPGNPWHKALLFTGFLTNGKPGGYSGLFHPSYDPKFLKLNHDHRMLITVEKKLGNILKD